MQFSSFLAKSPLFALFGLLWVFFLYGLFFGITGSLKWGVRIGSVLMIALSTAGYIINLLRGTYFTPSDFMALATAAQVISGYAMPVDHVTLHCVFMAVALCLVATKAERMLSALSWPGRALLKHGIHGITVAVFVLSGSFRQASANGNM